MSALDKLVALAKLGYSRGWDGLDAREHLVNVAAEETELRGILEGAVRAMSEVLDAFDEGDVDVFHPDYTIEEGPPLVTGECPEDDTCDCAGPRAINALARARDAARKLLTP